MEEATPACSSGCTLCSQAAKVQCLICLKRGIRPAPTFCGVACFREHWANHRCQHEGSIAASGSSEISSKSSVSTLSVGTNSTSSPVPCTGANVHSPSSTISQSPTRIGSNASSTSQHRRQRSQAFPRTLGGALAGTNSQREVSMMPGRCQAWTQEWAADPSASCHQPHPHHPWYEHGPGWNPNNAQAMHHVHRGVLQEQVVGPAGNWGYPSRWNHPYYWGGSF